MKPFTNFDAVLVVDFLVFYAILLHFFRFVLVCFCLGFSFLDGNNCHFGIFSVHFLFRFFIKDNSVNIFEGNHFVHTLTSSGKYELRIDMVISNTKTYAVYKRFSIGDVASRYKLNVGDYSGNAGKIVNKSIFYIIELALAAI